MPHNLKGYFDFKQAAEKSRKEHKPIFIDFTGHGCVNCRKMEANVWSDKEVLKRLQNDYIVVALYVDERFILPENEWFVSARDKQTKKTVGEQNTDLQIIKYQASAQPQYVLTDADGNRLLTHDVFYDANPENYIKYLDEGIAAYM